MTSPTRTKPRNQAKNHQSHPNEGRIIGAQRYVAEAAEAGRGGADGGLVEARGARRRLPPSAARRRYISSRTVCQVFATKEIRLNAGDGPVSMSIDRR
jgi:hypothetical protein